METQVGKRGIRATLTAMLASPVAVTGIIITTIAAGLILAGVFTSLAGAELGPYQGLVTFLVLPVFFIGGLTLIPLGIFLQRRRAAHAGGTPEDAARFTFDLTNPKSLRFALFVSFMTIINLSLLAVVSYEGYHYTESVSFCGQLCHTVMSPEFTAYQRSPHARVRCIECHIGSGASWFVKSKVSGLRQVYAVLTDHFSRPIPAPIENLRPARDTCEQCHWPEKFHGNKVKVFRKVPSDGNAAEPEVTAVMLYVGGRDAKTGKHKGIHWHVSHDMKVEYRAADESRQRIRDVRVVKDDGNTVTYNLKSLPEVPEGTPWRTMDCVDCHNRPTHIYDQVEPAVDKQLLIGRIDGTLPEIRRNALTVVQAEYTSQPDAERGMLDALTKIYRDKLGSEFEAKKSAVETAAKVLFDEVYKVNVYPELKIRWGTYPSHVGHHTEGGGCFRCHTDEHIASTGATISQNCDLCHSLMVEGEKESGLSESVKSYLY